MTRIVSRTVRLLVLGLACALTAACSTPPGGGAPAASAAADARDVLEIAIVPFGLAAGTSPPPFDVAEIVRADLEATGHLVTLAADALPARPTRLRDVDFALWRESKADLLLIGLVAGVHDGGHEVEFRLIDPRQESTLVGFMLPSAPDALERTAHQVAELILKQLEISAAPDEDPSSSARAHRRSPRDGSS